MRVTYWKHDPPNFGDELNSWLWDRILPGIEQSPSDVTLVGVGTVLNTQFLPSEGKKLVVGSGVGYGNAPDVSDRSIWDIRCVRGPLTAKALSLDEELGVLDPAALIADMSEFQDQKTINDAIFLPHWDSDLLGMWKYVAERAGLKYVSPCRASSEVILEIAQSGLVVTESLHGAILADAFRIPWIPVKSSLWINDFKWRDWAASIEVEYRPQTISVSTRTEAVLKQTRFWGRNWKAANTQKRAAQQSESPGRSELGAEKANANDTSSLRELGKKVLAAPAVRSLSAAASSEPMLSSLAVSTAQKEKLYQVLAGVKRDYTRS